MDRLQRTDLVSRRLSGQVFLSTADAFRCLDAEQAAQETWSI
jgi:hypothetical protein